MIMSKIIDIWKKLPLGDCAGLVKNLHSGNAPQFVYCTIENPNGFYGIGISYNRDIEVNLTSFSKLKDVHVFITQDSSYKSNNILVLQLNDNRLIDIFAVLCENLVQSITNLDDSKQAIFTIISHLEKWRALFSKINNEGLSILEQQGLYGELYLLKKMLVYFNDNMGVLESWVGVDRALRDFQNGECAIEVKTTSSSNHQKLTINSERQLDETLLSNLSLYHLSVEVSAKNGETLNQMVNNIRELLIADFVAQNIFNAKLMTVGYFDADSDLYDKRAYKFRRENSYKIQNEFPRVKESELMNGVGDVQYTIITDMCAEYLITETEMYKTLGLCKR